MNGMDKVQEQINEMMAGEPQPGSQAAYEAEIARLRWALTNLKFAVDREGWPAGWGCIRKEVESALNPPVKNPDQQGERQ